MQEVLEGKAFKFGDDVSTDLICPGRYYHLRSTPNILASLIQKYFPTQLNSLREDICLKLRRFES